MKAGQCQNKVGFSSFILKEANIYGRLILSGLKIEILNSKPIEKWNQYVMGKRPKGLKLRKDEGLKWARLLHRKRVKSERFSNASLGF